MLYWLQNKHNNEKDALTGRCGPGLSTIALRSDAQIRVNVNIGAPVAQQSWYGSDDDYYYMPQQDVYYNVQRRVYVYPEGGRWVYAPALPQRYGGYTYANAQYHRVRTRAPFERNAYYRQHYSSAYNNSSYGRHDNGRHNGWNKGGNGYSNGNGYNNNGGRGWNGNNDHYENNGHGRR